MNTNFAQRAKDVVAKHGRDKKAILAELDELRREQFNHEQQLASGGNLNIGHEIERGVEVEKEHAPTLEFVKNYIAQNGQVPPLEKFAKSIMTDHEKDFKNLSDDPRRSYYKSLINNGLSDEVERYALGGNLAPVNIPDAELETIRMMAKGGGLVVPGEMFNMGSTLFAEGGDTSKLSLGDNNNPTLPSSSQLLDMSSRTLPLLKGALNTPYLGAVLKGVVSAMFAPYDYVTGNITSESEAMAAMIPGASAIKGARMPSKLAQEYSTIKSTAGQLAKREALIKEAEDAAFRGKKKLEKVETPLESRATKQYLNEERAEGVVDQVLPATEEAPKDLNIFGEEIGNAEKFYKAIWEMIKGPTGKMVGTGAGIYGIGKVINSLSPYKKPESFLVPGKPIFPNNPSTNKKSFGGNLYGRGGLTLDELMNNNYKRAEYNASNFVNPEEEAARIAAGQYVAPTTATSPIAQSAGENSFDWGNASRYAAPAADALMGLTAKQGKGLPENVSFPAVTPIFISPEQLSTAPVREALGSQYRSGLDSLSGASGGSGAAIRSGMNALSLAGARGAGEAYNDIYSKNAMLKGDAAKFNAAASTQANMANIEQRNRGILTSLENIKSNQADNAATAMARREYLTSAMRGVSGIAKENKQDETLKKLFQYDSRGNRIDWGNEDRVKAGKIKTNEIKTSHVAKDGRNKLNVVKPSKIPNSTLYNPKFSLTGKYNWE